MDKKKWETKIKKATVDAGTYKPFFNDVIMALSEILEERDNAYDQYKKTGGHPVITHTNKNGSPNPCKNPILVLWDDLGKTALTYWRELGLTPSGLKKLNEDAIKIKKTNSFSDFLKETLNDKQTDSN